MFEKFKEIIKVVKSMINNNFVRSISEVAESQSVASDRMLNAIDLWLNMYQGNAPWLRGEGNRQQSLGIPAVIAGEIARSVTLEMEVNITGSAMADYLNAQLDPVRKTIRNDVELACAGGGIVFKPYLYGTDIIVEVIQANSFYPFEYDNTQKITGAYFIYRKWVGKKIYTRLEKHVLKGHTYTITNKAYESMVEESVGSECSLAIIPEWANIQPEVTINNIDSPLFAYFRIPQGNVIDFRSPLGSSVYSRAVNLIKEADLQYQRLLWEYEGGELAIDVPSDLLARDEKGELFMPERDKRLFRTSNLDPALSSGTELIKHWAPSLRDTNYREGLNRILMQIEDACFVSRGTLSDVNEAAKTATEIKMMKQRSYSTITDIQKSLERALDDLAYAMSVIAVLYELCPSGEYECTYTWDDSIVTDADTERARDMQEITLGIKSKYEYRMTWFGEDEETAKQKIAEAENAQRDDESVLFGNSEEENDE